MNLDRNLELDRRSTIFNNIFDWRDDDNTVKSILLYWVYKFNLEYQCFRNFDTINQIVYNTSFKELQLDSVEYCKTVNFINVQIQQMWDRLDERVLELLKA